MRQFLEAARKLNLLHQKIDHEFELITRALATVRISHSLVEIEEFIPEGNLFLEVEKGRLLNLTVPEFSLKEIEISSYDLLMTESELDVVTKHFRNILPELLEFASLWKKVELLASEIEVTRRRVNALEYILIPSLKETIQAIASRLEEIERSYQVQLMRVKEIIRHH
jgi:V/A-type H+-transporting ATPase subunit D